MYIDQVHGYHGNGHGDNITGEVVWTSSTYITLQWYHHVCERQHRMSDLIPLMIGLYIF